jgi:hypothetical protein
LHQAVSNANQKICAFFEPEKRNEAFQSPGEGRGALLTTAFVDINSRAGTRSLDNNEP